jgi:paraquat-inducible protein A
MGTIQINIHQEPPPMRDYQACHCCGQIHRVPALEPSQVAACIKCGARFTNPHEADRTALQTAAFWPAVFLPILEIERLGLRHKSSLITGIFDMLRHDEWFVGTVVLLFSVVFPLLKILLLLELSLLRLTHQRHRAFTYRLMENTGRWSMMDVMLLAFLVMLVKLGGVVAFHIGPAVIAFSGCVMMSLVASVSFNPHQIWEEGE